MAIITKYDKVPEQKPRITVTIEMICEADEIPAVDEFVAMMDVMTFQGNEKIIEEMYKKINGFDWRANV